MSKETYDRLFYITLAPTSVYLQLADQSTRYLEGVATDLLVKVRSAYILTYFMILDMGNAKDTPLIFGRPFLNTTNACIYVASGQIRFHFARRKNIWFCLWTTPLRWEIGKEASKQNQDEETKANWRTGETCQEEEE